MALLILNQTSKDGTIKGRLGTITGYFPTALSWGGAPKDSITQLGYPTNLDKGQFLYQTFSQGTNQVGNSMSFGSSFIGADGGPVVQNFGQAPEWSNTANIPNLGKNILVGVTNWTVSDSTTKLNSATILKPAGTPGLGFGDLLKTVCAKAASNCK